MSELLLVNPRGEIIPLLQSTYVRNYLLQPQIKHIPKKVAKDALIDDLQWIVSNATVKVVYLKMPTSADDEAIGWFAYRDKHLFFIYVKQAYRRNYVATKVLTQSGFSIDDPEFKTSHLNFHIISKFPRSFRSRIRYIPLYLYKKGIR